MGIVELLILSMGLSMDAFAVSICKGLSLKQISLKHCAIMGAWFGGFQALMPLIGYLLGTGFAKYVTAIDHWIAFVLLAVIGGSMVKESTDRDEDNLNPSLDAKTMLILAIATSIDALAVGVTFAFLSVNILSAVLLIGVVTFLLSGIGVKVGAVFGAKYKSRAELAGGLVLILLGVKILLEHMGIFGA